jgi:hypothetical protein
MTNNNTDIEVIHKPLSQIAKRILIEDLKDKHKHVTELSRAVGCDRGTVVKHQQSPAYIQAYNAERDLINSKITSVSKHSLNELKTAMIKLKGLVEEDPSLQSYAGYVKLLTDVAKNTVDIEDTTTDEDLDLDGTKEDLITLFTMIEEGVDPVGLANYYIDNGKAPATPEDVIIPSSLTLGIEGEEEDIDSPPQPKGAGGLTPNI